MSVQKQTIIVVGTGYVGLPAALLLAKAGHEVIGVDINENLVRAINEGIMHIREEELQILMDDPAVKQNLRAQSTPVEGDVFIIAVPTPLDARKKIADMSYVDDAVESIIPYLRAGNLVIIESTIKVVFDQREYVTVVGICQELFSFISSCNQSAFFILRG